MEVITIDRASEIQKKEVINISDGRRLGFVYDVEVDLATGKIGSIIVPGETKMFGLFGKYEDYVIPWKEIKKIGDDIILVDLDKKEHIYEK